MAFIDYYKIMGVKKDTPQNEIREAYKRRAKQFHPDLHPNDPKAKAKFQALNEAYDVLNDPEKRRKYDQYGQHWQEAEGFHDQRSGAPNFDGFDFNQFQGGGHFSDFFEQLFGRQGAPSGGFSTFQSAYARPKDAEATVTIDMYTALLGGEVLLRTADSQLKLKVKPGTQNGTKVRLKGKGHSLPDGTRTDLILTYHVQLPAQLSERQKELLREMQQS